MSIVIAVSSDANKMCWRWKWVADNDVCTLKQTYKRTIITLYFIWINSSECITILSQWNQLNTFSHCNVSYDATWHRIVCDECVRKYRPRIKAVEKCSRQCLKKQFKSVAGNSIGFSLSAALCHSEFYFCHILAHPFVRLSMNGESVMISSSGLFNIQHRPSKSMCQQ